MKKYILLLLLVFTTTLSFAQKNKIIAHRGYWDIPGSAQNSIISLRMAAEIGVYGSEFDVSITKDGVLVVNHDATIHGHNIEHSNYEKLKNLTLSNNELLPTLKAYLTEAKRHPDLKLILEIKPHDTEEDENRAVDSTLVLVNKMGSRNQIEYISFSLNICKRLMSNDPKAKVSYLNGELSPKELKDQGFYGLDYNYKVIDKHPEWPAEAHSLGLIVNVWTVNDQDRIDKYLKDDNIDYITTNKPDQNK